MIDMYEVVQWLFLMLRCLLQTNVIQKTFKHEWNYLELAHPKTDFTGISELVEVEAEVSG